MKSIVYLLCIIGLIACKGKPAAVRVDSIVTTETSNKDTSSVLYALNKDYSVLDTGEYSTGIMGGSYAIVKKYDGTIDTIDKGFGIQDVNSGQQIYLKLTHSPDAEYDGPAGEKHRSLTLYDEYFMLENGKKTPLKSILPGFDEFSSPNVIASKVYYWSIDRQTSPLYKITAVEYDPATKKTQSHFLFKDGVETDDTGYLSAPYLEGDTIHYYHSAKQKWKFSPSFKPYN